MFFKKKPDVQNLKVFGSEAFVHIPDQKRKKLDSKSQKLIFVGYSPENKGYRFLNKETDKVIVSRDATFVEIRGKDVAARNLENEVLIEFGQNHEES